MPRWTSANVLQAGGDTKRLWQFSLRGDNPQLLREESKLPAEPLPGNLISKDWQTLYKPRLNIAWLPADKVFLRVIQLPPSDSLDETVSMLELQLEKLSPLPVAQIVWTFDLMPKGPLGTQTAIVVIAARNLVEDYLGKLEGQGYIADRLEVPFIDQLLATRPESNGVWVYPGPGVESSNCLVAWWYTGSLQNVSLLHLPPAEERAAFMQDQFAQMTWAGELEGWLAGVPKRHLVADEEVAAAWLPLLETPDHSVQVVAPAPAAGLAAMTARRAARDGARTSLVPPEFVARYRQQFVDRIWMRSVGAAIVLYLLAVVLYIAWLQYVEYDVTKVEQGAKNLQASYTNALKLKSQVQVMEDQLNLQFAALQCYRAIAEKLPQGLTLDSLTFSRGRNITVFGSGEPGSQQALFDFNDALRKYAVDGQPIFVKVEAPNTRERPGGQSFTWNFACDLKRGETE